MAETGDNQLKPLRVCAALVARWRIVRVYCSRIFPCSFFAFVFSFSRLLIFSSFPLLLKLPRNRASSPALLLTHHPLANDLRDAYDVRR